MAVWEQIEGLLADLQTITDTARAGVISRRDEVLEPGETRPAAILFVDIVGFTPLAHKLTSEVLTKVVDRMFRIFELTVRAHGGYCDKVIGDAALYVFAGHPNYPPVCEAALRAALKLQERLAQINESLGETEVHLAIRQGVAFGEVTRQAVGAEQAQLTVMGDTVNRAQRLQATAQPDTIQTTSRVLEKAGDAFTSEKVSKLELKGIGEVTAYIVSRMEEQPVQLRGAFRHLCPLTGREAELEQGVAQVKAWLATSYPRETWDITRTSTPLQGRNRLLLLRGVPAVGKSRLAYEIAERAKAELGAVFATAHSAENAMLAQFTAELARVAGLTSKNLPRRWEKLCANAAHEVSPEYAERQRRHLRLLAFVLGCKQIDVNGVGQADPKSFALSCQLAIRACCELAAHEVFGGAGLRARQDGSRAETPAPPKTPVILIVEDLQWLGGIKDVLADVLARACLPQPLLVIGTARPEYQYAPGSLQEGESCIIELGVLPRVQGDAMVQALLPGLALPDAIANELHEKAAGIPYFYEDFVRMLVRKRLVEEQAGQWELTRELVELDVPDDLQTLMLGRLDQLGTEVRELARRASVLGRTFQRDLLVAIEQHLGFTHEGHPDDDLQTMLAEKLLAIAPSDRYFFEHALLHQAAYSSLLRVNRRLLHRLAAEILAGLYVPGGAGELELLAQMVGHLEASGQYAQAHSRACALLLLLASMLRLADWDEWEARTRQLWEKSAGASAREGDATGMVSAAYLRAQAELHWRQARYPQALELFEQSLELLRGAGDEHGAALTLHGMGDVHRSRGDYDQALVLYGQCLEVLRRVGDERGTAQTLTRLGNVYSARGDYEQALELYEQGLAVERRVGDERGAALTLNYMGNVYRSRGDYDQALQLYEQSLEVLGRVGDEHGVALALMCMGNVYGARGDYDRALELFEQSLDVKRRVGDERGAALTLNNMGIVYRSRGEYARALELFGQSLELERRVGNEHGAAITLNNMGNVCASSGDTARALELYEQSREVMHRVGDEYGVALTVGSMSDVYLATGELALARQALSESQAGFEKVGAKEGLAQLHLSWVRYWLALYRQQSKHEGAEDGSADGVQDASPTTPAGILAQALEHLRITTGFLTEIGQTPRSKGWREITKARLDIIDFALEHGLKAEAAGLIADQKREQGELASLHVEREGDQPS